MQKAKKTIINVNGTVTDSHDAKISILDRGFLYGDSIYEVTYSEDNTVLYFDEHLDRLYNSAGLIGMIFSFTREELISQILKTLKAAAIPRAYIRIIITRGGSELSLAPCTSYENNFIIIVKEQLEYPQDQYNDGLKLCVSSVLRNSIKAINPNVKSGNYLNNIMAISEAKKLGFDDAIMKNADGLITEGTTFNIWMVKDGVILTPQVSSGLLKGITRDKILNICKDNSLAYKECELTEKDFLMADEIFISSSTKGMMSVSRINDHKLGENLSAWPITAKLQKIYNDNLAKHKELKIYQY